MPEFEDILYEKKDHIATITINRPEVYNAFRTLTLREMAEALDDSGLDEGIGVVVITGAGDKAFCTGGDTKEAAQSGGYNKENNYWHSRVHYLIRSIPKPVIAAVNGWAVGGGHIIHVVCDLTIASETARFGQAGPRVGSFDAGFGSAYLARLVGPKKAKEIWFLCRHYTAREAQEMGLVNKVVPPEKLMEEVRAWCDEILGMSPTAIKFEKLAINADSDHISAYEAFSENAVRLFWNTEEAAEAKKAYGEKRKPDFSKFRK